MAASKKTDFSSELQGLADYARVLSHPARIAILHEIASKKSCICGEIVEVMPLAQSTVSQHLKELKDAGLIKGEIEGIRSCYCINDEGIAALERTLGNFMEQISQIRKNLKCC